jgi:hypothetical protein
MKLCTYNEFEYCKVFDYLSVCKYYYVNLNPVWIWILYEFEFEIFKYSLNMYILNGVDWLKVTNTIDPSLVSAR